MEIATTLEQTLVNTSLITIIVVVNLSLAFTLILFDHFRKKVNGNEQGEDNFTLQFD